MFFRTRWKSCKPEGCRYHTLAVLKCIYDMKRDFWFANNATVKVLNETIINGRAKSQGTISCCSSSSSSNLVLVLVLLIFLSCYDFFFNRHTLRNIWMLQLQLFLRLITPIQKKSTRKHTRHLFQH